MASTRRKKIIQLLRDSRVSVLDLARLAGAPVKSVLSDLEHIRRGLKEGERWMVTEAECQRCGFVFEGRERLNKPSRCPKCRSEEIQEAAYGISGLDS